MVITECYYKLYPKFFTLETHVKSGKINFTADYQFFLFSLYMHK